MNLTAYIAQGATPETAALAYVLGYGANDIHDGTGAAGDRGKFRIGGVGAVTDPANAGALKAFVAARSQAADPRSANGAAVYTTGLTGGETAVFNAGVLNNQPLATHATAVLMQFLRECKGGALDDGATGGD